jgi:hypothetical protein
MTTMHRTTGLYKPSIVDGRLATASATFTILEEYVLHEFRDQCKPAGGKKKQKKLTVPFQVFLCAGRDENTQTYQDAVHGLFEGLGDVTPGSMWITGLTPENHVVHVLKDEAWVKAKPGVHFVHPFIPSIWLDHELCVWRRSGQTRWLKASDPLTTLHEVHSPTFSLHVEPHAL